MKKIMFSIVSFVALIFTTQIFAGAMSDIDLGTRETIEGHLYNTKKEHVADIWNIQFSYDSGFDTRGCRFTTSADVYTMEGSAYFCVVCFKDVEGYRRPQNVWAKCKYK